MRWKVDGISTSKKIVCRKEIVWCPPKLGLFKINFDGFSKGNPGMSCASAIARNLKEEIVAMVSIRL